jgi:hypothetical protein
MRISQIPWANESRWLTGNRNLVASTPTNNPRINLPIRENWGQSVLRYPNGSKDLRDKRFPIGSPLEVSPLTW